MTKDNNHHSELSNDSNLVKFRRGIKESMCIMTEISLLAEKIAKEENVSSVANYDDEFFSLIEELCFCYINENDDGRKLIRNFISEIKGSIRFPGLIYVVPSTIYVFIKSIAKRICTKDDGSLLEIGLAAASIEEGRMDFRDLYVSLEELHKKVKEVDIAYGAGR